MRSWLPWALFADRLGEDVLERRHARAQVPHLDAVRAASAKIAC